jgi:hypothetical protein
MTKLMHVAVVIVLIHALMPGAMLISHTHADKVTQLEALYGKQVAICKGDKMVYVDWSSLPKDHLPHFPVSAYDNTLPTPLQWLLPFGVVLLAIICGWCLSAGGLILFCDNVSRWLMAWHSLRAHAPPR